MEINLIIIGIIAALVGLILILIGTTQSSKVKTEGGFVTFIGPIPIIGATSKGMIYLMIIISILLILFLILNKKLFI